MTDATTPGDIHTNGDILMTSATKLKHYRWKPQKDITTYELVLCLPIFSMRSAYGASLIIDSLPEEAARHFTEVK